MEIPNANRRPGASPALAVTDSSPAAAPPSQHPKSLYVSPRVMYHALSRLNDYLAEAGRITDDEALRNEGDLARIFGRADANRDLFVKAMMK